MDKLLLLVVVAAFASVVSAGCATGRFGDCSCTSDVVQLIADQGITGFTPTCVARTWTIVGSGVFNIKGANWNINSDAIQLGAGINASGATLGFTVNSVNATQSGFLNIQGPATLSVFFSFVLGDWDRNQNTAVLKIPFLSYVSTTGAPISAYAPTLQSADRFCYTVLPGAAVSANGTVLSLESSVQKKGGSTCGGPSSRGWVVAFIVIVILWGAGLGLFALITCKIDSCYSMWWALK